LEAVLSRMAQRDQVDGSRSVAPMARAPDAIEVPTEGVGPEQVIERILHLARARGAQPHLERRT
jgi:CMP/dCMP kinase